MVVDSPILLAIFFGESHAEWAAARLKEHQSGLRMSTVNLAEVLILLKDRRPRSFEGLREKLLTASIRFVPPTISQAEIAAEARLKYPLNLGDCFAYALAKEEGLPLLTLDGDFKKTDIPILMP